MPLPKILQQLECLDKSSPRFPDELMNLLRGKVYKRRVPKLQDEDATWLVEYLDNVSLCVVFSMFSTQPA